MVNIHLHNLKHIGDKVVHLKRGVITIYAIPTPKQSLGFSIDVVSISNIGKHFVTAILYKPDEEKTIVVFETVGQQIAGERLIGIVESSEVELSKIHPSVINGSLPLINEHNFHVGLPRIPSTSSEYIILFGILYQFEKTLYSSFQNEVSCIIREIGEENTFWERFQIDRSHEFLK